LNLIRFLCIQCDNEFDCDVGAVDFDTPDGMPGFELDIVCPGCKVAYTGSGDEFSKNFELTEMGQSQLTELMLES